MNSKLIYHNLCESRKELKKQWGHGSGLHCHHITPKHSGGTDDESNLTYLTPREHVIAHYLLWRIYKNPNDLRSMHMLGAELSVEQRRIVGKYCHQNKIGFFNSKYDDVRKHWSKSGVAYQMENQIGIHNPGNYKKHASLGGKASIKSENNPWSYWATPEGQKERASMGGKSHKGKKCMYRPGDKTFKRVSPEDIEKYLNKGYTFGSPHSPRKGCRKTRPVMIEGKKYNSIRDAAESLDLTFSTVAGRIKSNKQPNWVFCNEP
jgi:hypothetical protein